MREQAIRVTSIHVPKNHRRTEDPDIETLRRSILNEGLKEPLLVVRNTGRNAKKKYILADGSRRLRVLKKVQGTVPAIIRQPDDDDPLEFARSLRVIANYHRQGFYPSQRAHYLKILSEKFKVPMKDIAEACGLTQVTLKSWLAVNDCSKEIKMMLDNGKLPVASGNLLSSLRKEGQKTVVEKVRDRAKVSYKEVKDIVTKVHRHHPEHIRKPLSRLRRIHSNLTGRTKGKYIKNVDAATVEAKIEEREKEIAHMRREILQAKPIIDEILRTARLRAALPSNVLSRLDMFAKEEAHG